MKLEQIKPNLTRVVTNNAVYIVSYSITIAKIEGDKITVDNYMTSNNVSATTRRHFSAVFSMNAKELNKAISDGTIAVDNLNIEE